MGVEDVLDLLGGDVLAFTDNDVLDPAGESYVAVLAHDGQVAAAESSHLVERLGVQRRVPVALEELWAGDPNLAFFAAVALAAVRPTDCDFGGEHRMAFSVGQLVIGIGGRTLADHGAFGHAVAVGHRDPHLGLYLEEHLGWLWGAAAGQQAQRGDDRLVGLLALHAQEHGVKDRAAAGHGHAMPVEGLDGGHQVELFDEHGREAVGQKAHQVVGSPDVGVREGNGAHVGGLHVQGSG